MNVSGFKKEKETYVTFEVRALVLLTLQSLEVHVCVLCVCLGFSTLELALWSGNKSV